MPSSIIYAYPDGRGGYLPQEERQEVDPETRRVFAGLILGSLASLLMWVALYYGVRAIIWIVPRLICGGGLWL